VECYKCELHATALQACFIALKHYQAHLQPEFRDRFHFIVRKYGKGDLEDIEDLLSPCPNCDADMANYDLNCKACHKEIPFCVVSVSLDIFKPSKSFKHLKQIVLLLKFLRDVTWSGETLLTVLTVNFRESNPNLLGGLMFG